MTFELLHFSQQFKCHAVEGRHPENKQNEWYMMDGFRTKPSGTWDKKVDP